MQTNLYGQKADRSLVAWGRSRRDGLPRGPKAALRVMDMFMILMDSFKKNKV